VQYYFNANQLQAVREGPWKMAIAPQHEQNRIAGQPQPVSRPPFPKLYNLATDLGETTDVASNHPDVGQHLQELVARMDRDLGKKGVGPGVRPPDVSADPRPLLMRK